MSLKYAYIKHTVKRGVNTLRKTIKRYKNKKLIGGANEDGDDSDSDDTTVDGREEEDYVSDGSPAVDNVDDVVDGGGKANVIEGQHVKDRIIYTIKITVPGTIPQCIEKGD
jgi:hypothetical protein